ncbi:DNA topoisomerase [Paramuribaculum intestinale]|uniref:DNA topoisomerase n=1 Tax=Paramuribaculum intestinale TaxID=2094151 RepID=UPI0025B12663|nr:DNA topoisomerase [Paramuribaculum intestinale]
MAETIARAIDANTYHEGYYYGNGYAVTWTNGEIIEAEYKRGEKFVMNSGQDMRQMYAHHFNFKMRNYDALLGWEKSKADEAQLSIIKALWTKSSVVVNAMEPTFEGELAFLNLYWYLRMSVTVRRAWLSRLRKRIIINAVEKGTCSPNKHEKWLAGELVNFFLKADAAAADNALDIESTENNATDDSGDVELNIVKGQTLHNMVTLWMDATMELGYDFEPTFLIAHKLYAKGLISYPYLYQNGIPGNVYDSMRRDFRVLEHNAQYGHMAKEVGWLSTRNTFHNGETPYNGHGIVTTGLHPTDLSRDEERLYNLIVKRVIEAFTPVENEYQKKSRKKHNSCKKAG